MAFYTHIKLIPTNLMSLTVDIVYGYRKKNDL